MKRIRTLNRPLKHSRGIALVTALLLLSLLTIMTLSMVIATTSDTLIDGYYRNFRGSFYAADSGITVAREYMLQQILANIPSTYTLANGSPIPTTVPDASPTATTRGGVMTNVLSNYGSSQSVTGSQSASWPGTFTVDSSATGGINNSALVAGTSAAGYTDACVPVYTGAGTTAPTCTSLGTPAANYTITGYKYTYSYKITAIGQSRANESHTIEEDGSFIVTVDKGTPAGTNTAFAAYGMFIDQSPICNGSTLVNGTITGPVFTNGAWNLNNGSYIFTDAVASHLSNFGYTDSSNCYQAPGSSTTHAYTGADGTNFGPTFQGSVTLGAPSVTLPADSFQQERAVLDGRGLITTVPSPGELSAALVGANGTSPYVAGATSGVYLPATAPANSCLGTPGTFNGGGIYVEGNADSVMLSAATVSGHNQQLFTIKQGSTVTTVTLDLTAGTTKISDTSGNTSCFTGLPQNNTTSPASEGAMLFVNGSINGSSSGVTTGLSGPASGPAIQDASAVTVTAKNDISITGNILYKTEPVTLTTADSLVTGADSHQVLGIFTAGGNVNLNVPTSGSNLEIDASIATLQANASWALQNPGNQINTLNIVGGRIQNSIQNINSLHRNVYFDRRFSQGGFAPPWFPSTSIVSNGVVNAVIVTSPPNRVSWTDKTAM